MSKTYRTEGLISISQMKECYADILRWQKDNRIINEFLVQEIDGGLRIGVQPIRPLKFVYYDVMFK